MAANGLHGVTPNGSLGEYQTLTAEERPRVITTGDPADLAQAMPIYREVHSLLRWDSKTEFVPAIKLAMDTAGRRGGRCRPPRRPLEPEVAERIVADTQAALAKGYR